MMKLHGGRCIYAAKPSKQKKKKKNKNEWAATGREVEVERASERERVYV